MPKEAVENALEAEVTGVDLSKNYFEKFPGQLEPLMPQLYDLNLSSNRLDALPSSLIGLGANLQYLNLANNKLSQLPPEIGLLANLREICLSCNRMDKVRNCLICFNFTRNIFDFVNFLGSILHLWVRQT